MALQVDQASMAEFEIKPNAIVKGNKLGSGQFGGTCAINRGSCACAACRAARAL